MLFLVTIIFLNESSPIQLIFNLTCWYWWLGALATVVTGLSMHLCVNSCLWVKVRHDTDYMQQSNYCIKGWMRLLGGVSEIPILPLFLHSRLDCQLYWLLVLVLVNRMGYITLIPEQNYWYFVGNIFKCISWMINFVFWFKFQLSVFPKNPRDSKCIDTGICLMLSGIKPLPEPMLTNINVTIRHH